MDENSKRNRGVKRKRIEEPTDGNINLGAKISGKLHHDLKEVRKAAKKAKAFETQKLAKKLKDLRKKGGSDGEIKGMEMQLEILKCTDHEPIANTALKTKINKDRLLSDNIHVQASISTELVSNLLVPATAGTPEAKIQSRLLSSKTLATEIALTVGDLKAVIQPELKGDLQGDAEDGEDSPVVPEHYLKAKGGSYVKVDDENMDDEEGGDSDSLEDEDHPETKRDDAGWESGTIGSERGTEDGWESGRSKVARSASECDVDNNSDDDFQTKPPRAKQRQSAVVQATPKLTGTSSTFLPSLSVGFTRGDSEGSEWSDNDAEIVESNQKKNRRGQRARRAIWEKKYGENANHRKVEHEAAKAANRGLRPDVNGPRNLSLNKGTPVANRRSGHKDAPQHRHAADTGWGQRTSASQANAPSRKTVAQRPQPTQQRDEQPLHPSWEAKRKLKEKQSAGILPAQGTKIKF